MPSGGSVRRGRVVTVYHNGSSFRDSVPVWKETVGERPSGGAVTRVNMVTVCRNGSVSRDSVPVRLFKRIPGMTDEKGAVAKCDHSYPSS